MFNRIIARPRPRPKLCSRGYHRGFRASPAWRRPSPASARPDKMKADVRAPDTQAAKGVTDTVLAAIDLEKEPANIKDRQLRFRKLTIEPGGIVPWHSHGDRPAIIYIAEGEIVEYASNCSAPIMHKTGEIRPETSGTVALVAEPRQQDRRSLRRRCPARQERPQHVTTRTCVV